MNTIRIVAAVVDVRQLKLYREDGSTIDIPQGDPRVARIIAEVTPVLREGGVAKVDITIDDTNAFRAFEEASQKKGGLVKLFRLAKKKVDEFFSGRVPDQQIGTIPNQEEDDALGAEAMVTIPPSPVSDQVAIPVTTTAKQIDQLDAALDDIMKHAVPVSTAGFSEKSVNGDDEGDTIVAVMEREDGRKTLVPHIEKIKPQLAHAVQAGTTAGVGKFMSRMAGIIDTRRHSVEDLLKFMQRGDLPIAEDGSIIIYKVLRRHRDQKDTYVDCHTKLVTQKIGSYVHMDEKLVDPNRRNECSNGLHVARRGYIKSFGGDVCVMAKVRPEDVIAVPEYDANKMRVCGYHILFELSDADYQKLKADRPITDTVEGQTLLAKAIAGQHVGILEYVKIGGHHGTNVTVTPATSDVDKKRYVKSDKPADEKPKLAVAIDVDAKVTLAPVVDPKEVSKAVVGAREDKEPAKLSLAQRAEQLLGQIADADTAMKRDQAVEALKAFKRQARKSWEALGLPADTGEMLAEKAPEPVSTRPVTSSAGSTPVAEPKLEDPAKSQTVAIRLLKEGRTNTEVARKTGLSKDQVYRLKKKLGK